MRFRRKRHTYITPSPEYTERLDRLQFIAGQVGLYSHPTYTRQRPDSSRPQAARSRVACAKRCECGSAAGLRARSGVEAALRPPRRRPGTRRDLTGSNLWPGKSGCIATLPIPANVQTRAAPKRRGVGLRARSGVNAAQPPGCVREAVWMPHCGYSAFMWAGGQMMARALPTMSVTGPTSAEWLSCEMARLSPRRKYSPSPSTVSG